MCVSYRIREWHHSSVIVQIHSHTIKMLFNMKTKTWRPSVLMILHSPDISVKESVCLPLVWCCSYSKNPGWTLFNLHIPAVCSWVQRVLTQNTAKIGKSLRIIRKRLILLAESHTGQIIRHDKPFMSRVWIQNHRSWWDTINRCCYYDVHIMIKSEPNTDDYELWHSSCWSNTSDIFLSSLSVILCVIYQYWKLNQKQWVTHTENIFISFTLPIILNYIEKRFFNAKSYICTEL